MSDGHFTISVRHIAAGPRSSAAPSVFELRQRQIAIVDDRRNDNNSRGRHHISARDDIIRPRNHKHRSRLHDNRDDKHNGSDNHHPVDSAAHSSGQPAHHEAQVRVQKRARLLGF